MGFLTQGRIRALLFGFLCLVIGLPAVVNAQSVQNEACYQGQCYPTVAQAEAALRAEAPFGELFERAKSYASDVSVDGNNANVSMELEYRALEEPPQKIYATRYIMSFGPPPCDMRSDACPDEATVLDGFLTGLQAAYPGCELRNGNWTGDYAKPFFVVGTWSSSNEIGVIDFGNRPDIKTYGVDITCPEWGSPAYYIHQNFGIQRQQYFDCRPGHHVLDGYPVTYLPQGAPKTLVRKWPYFCGGEPSRFISIRPKQVCGYCTNNPIIPSTGDKYRAEKDFDFGNISFTRYYHSLGHVSGDRGSAPYWSHTFEQRVITSNTVDKLLVDERGFLEVFRRTSDAHYASHSRPGRLLDSDGSLYFLRDPEGRVTTFNRNGSLSSITDPADPKGDISVVYDDYGELQAVIRRDGRQLKFGYTDGRLTSVMLPDGQALTYEYDARKNLVAVQYPDGSKKRYAYQESGLAPDFGIHALTGITSEDGRRYATFGYGADGRASSSALHSGNGFVDGVAVSYLDDSHIAIATPLGDTRTLTIQPGFYRRVIGISDGAGTSSTTFGADGYATREVSIGGRVTESAYAANRLTTQTEAKGATGERSRTYTYTPSGRVASNTATELRGGSPVAVRGGSFAYDTADRRTASCSADPAIVGATAYICGSVANAPVGVRQSLSTYCEQPDIDAGTCPRLGLVTKVDGPRTDIADVTTYTYRMTDAAGCDTAPTTCAYRRGDLWKVTNAKGQVSETLAYDGAGRPLSMKDANGIVTDLEYSPRGWLTASKVRGSDNAVETDDVITRMDYFPTGLVQTVTQPDGTFTTFEYDAAHRLTAIANNLGDRIAYTLDNAGNRTQEDTKDASGTLRRTLSRVYNQLGQLTAAKDAYGVATSMTYDASGNTDLATDAKARSTDNDYDPLDRLTRTLQDTAGIKAETKFGYDAQDNLTAVVDPKGLTTGYTYNGLGDLTRLTSPDTGVTDYTYDSAGNLKTRQDARGASAKATYSYDALNRLTGIAYATTSPNLNVTYAYDTSNTVCAAGETFAIGRMSKMTDGSGNTQYCYDRFGRLVRKVQTTNAKVFTTTYQFAVSGRLLAMTYPSGLKVDYGFDAAGRPNSVKATRPGQAQETLVGNVTYYPFGPVGSLTFAGGRVVTRQFDKNYRPTLVQDATGIGLHDLLGWDEVGNLTSLANSATTPLSTPLANYRYDTLNRLTGRYAPSDTGQTNPLQGYAYDATGNRLSDTKVTSATATTAYTYPATNHRLTRVGTVARTYDAMGNMLTGTVGGVAKTYTYDVTGRLNVAKNGSTVQMNYAYNGKGEQVRRYPTATSTAQTYEVYNEAGQWIGEYDSTGAKKQEFIWLGDLPVGVYANSPGSTTAFQLYEVQADHLGTPRVVIDPSRSKAVWTWPLTGEAFGTTAPSQDPDADGKTFVLDMRFPGQRYEIGSGLNYNYFRDYEAGTGRYAESDPIGLAGGVSTFGYAGGSPRVLSDPTGHAAGALGAGWGSAPGAAGSAAGASGAAGIGATAAAYTGGALAAGYLGWQIGSALNGWMESTFGSSGEALYDMTHPGETQLTAQESRRQEEAANRAADYRAYKDLQMAGPQWDPDPCRYLRNKIQWRRQVIQMRDAFDMNYPLAKYPGGRHAVVNVIERLQVLREEQQYRDMCGEECPL